MSIPEQIEQRIAGLKKEADALYAKIDFDLVGHSGMTDAEREVWREQTEIINQHRRLLMRQSNLEMALHTLRAENIV